MEGHRLEWARRWVEKPKDLFSQGKASYGSGEKFAIENPATGETLAYLNEPTPAEIQKAVEGAEAAFITWRYLPRKEKALALRALGEIVRTHHAELATLEALTNGKTYREAYEDDLPDAADVFDYYAGWVDKYYGESCPVEPGRHNFTVREPYGVCALIVPWNYPLLLANWKIAPALAMGNTVIVKPAPYTSHSLLRFLELVHEKNILPPGVLNAVVGGASVGDALARHPKIQKLSFTGSTAIGKKIVAAAGESNLKSVSLELGGKAPNILFDDLPDFDRALERSFQVMFSHKGEKCTEPTRFLIQRGLYETFAKKLAEKAEKIVCGDPFDPKTNQGPQCHRAHFEKVLSYLEAGKKEGAKCLAGGHRDETGANSRGYYVRPTIFGNVSPAMKIAQEEIFGPVLCLIPFDTEDEAIQIANSSPYGLAAGLYTKDALRAHRVADALQAGMVFVNHYGCYDFCSPFGGWKESGWGQEMGVHSLQSYTRLKSMWFNYR